MERGTDFTKYFKYQHFWGNVHFFLLYRSWNNWWKINSTLSFQYRITILTMTTLFMDENRKERFPMFEKKYYIGLI